MTIYRALLSLIIIAHFSCGTARHYSKSQQEISDTDVPTVGFACGYGGSASAPVKLFTKYISGFDTTSIKEMLTSANPACKFLSVCICEYYSNQGRVLLTEAQKKTIENAYSSDEFIFLCAGCTVFSKERMHFLLRFSTYRNSITEWIMKIEKQAD